ncbi:hypothetical protein MMPV_000213 [Pyropia vietnamensis]
MAAAAAATVAAAPNVASLDAGGGASNAAPSHALESPLPLPFHAGELAAQAAAGTRGVAADLGRLLRPAFPAAAGRVGRGGAVDGGVAALLAGLRLAIVTSVVVPPPGGGGRPNAAPPVWVSPIFGSPGFVAAPTVDTLTIRAAGHLPPSDMLWSQASSAAATGAGSSLSLGVLALDLPTRRRWRANGTWVGPSAATAAPDSGRWPDVLEVRLAEVFPNCPKYIHTRELVGDTGEGASLVGGEAGARLSATGDSGGDSGATTAAVPTPKMVADVATAGTAGTAGTPPPSEDSALSAADVALITAADTFFIGTTYAPTAGSDASHRGGPPGFVAVDRCTAPPRLSWTDYRGNGMYQTAGNLAADGRAGLLFIDWSSGGVLQLTPPPPRWVFTAAAVRRAQGVTPYRWALTEVSPYVPPPPRVARDVASGDADAADDEEDAEVPTTALRLRHVKTVRETETVSTFRFTAPRRVVFAPGQYATLRLAGLPGVTEPLTRTWTLSEAAQSATEGDDTLEVSVKRKPGGVASTALHALPLPGVRGGEGSPMRVRLLGIGGRLVPPHFVRSSSSGEGGGGGGGAGSGDKPGSLLLLTAGIGITPAVAMVRGLATLPLAARPRALLVHQEGGKGAVPFDAELRRRAELSGGRFRLVLVISRRGARSSETAVGTAAVGAAAVGAAADGRSPSSLPLLSPPVEEVTARIDAPLLRRLGVGGAGAPWGEWVCLCGPPKWMDGMREALGELGVEGVAIMTEGFDF